MRRARSLNYAELILITMKNVTLIVLRTMVRRVRWLPVTCESSSKRSPFRGLPFMTSAKFPDFFYPPPPLSAFSRNLAVLTSSAFPLPLPLQCGRLKWKLPYRSLI